MKKLVAEFIGTFWLIVGGCGTAIFAASNPDMGIGKIGIAVAFGLSLVTMFYSIGHISGCHLNPAVTLGLATAGKFDPKNVPTYILAQVLGAITGAALVYLVVLGKVGYQIGSFAANGYEENSPEGYSIISAFITELVMTFIFLFIILGATYEKAHKAFSGLAIGLGLTLIHLVSMPITNTSINPARSLSQALFAEGNWALPQLWLFWVSPILGALLAGAFYQFLFNYDPIKSYKVSRKGQNPQLR